MVERQRSPARADWFEVTNTGTTAVDITGWKMDDNSNVIRRRGGAQRHHQHRARRVGHLHRNERISPRPKPLSSTLVRRQRAGRPADRQLQRLRRRAQHRRRCRQPLQRQRRAAGRRHLRRVAHRHLPNLQQLGRRQHNNDANHATQRHRRPRRSAAANDTKEIGSPGTAGKLFISEVAPWSSGNSPVEADWFEVTNSTGVRHRYHQLADGRQFAVVQPWGEAQRHHHDPLGRIGDLHRERATSPARGQPSAISGSAAMRRLVCRSARIAAPASASAATPIRSTSTPRTACCRRASPSARRRAHRRLRLSTTRTAITSINTPLTQLSAIGVRGGTTAANDVNEIGSPGATVNPAVNAAPTAVALINPKTSIAENTSTADAYQGGRRSDHRRRPWQQ